MTVSVQDLKDRYGVFNGGDPAAIVAQFAPDAVYRQIESGRVAIGPEQIGQVMAGWKHFFGGAQIENIEVAPADFLVADGPDGATQCFTVDFVGCGTYDNTIPGLEEVAPAKGQDVRLPIGETVWLNDAGQFIRVDNTIQVSALN
jgi:hypothetical protein